MKKQAVLSLSGGLDSSSLLLHLLANDYEVTALGFDYGQKHKVELERAKDLVAYLNANRLTHTDHVEGGFIEAYPAVRHQIIKLDGLAQLLNSTLVEGGKDVPHEYYAAENQKQTVVPNRNKIFSSITQAVALSIATKPITDDCTIGQEVIIALGVHAGDSDIYPDCREEFRQADLHAFRVGNWDSHLVDFYTPYMKVTKREILQDGTDSCIKLGLNFDEVYKRTNTSYDPDPITGKSSGKSGADIERILAFNSLGLVDPVEYVEGWEKSLEFALKAEKDFLGKK
jgi:7-cyano-7-deazaguanine synthase